MPESQTQLQLNDICSELGLSPQFLFELAARGDELYETFELPKRGGGKRRIAVPKDVLKNVQRTLLHGLLCRYAMPKHVHGCVKGRSAVSNAEGHVKKPFVINIDLSDFFGSIKAETVQKIFETAFKCDFETAAILSKLCTFGGVLPQGAPTSPTLANLCALDLDKELIAVCEKSFENYAHHYTRYVDDITISGGPELAFYLADFYRAIERCGFRANPNKLKMARPNSRQKVTGLVVNQKLNPPKKLVRRVRQQLYFATKFGLISHCDKRDTTPELFWQQIRGLIGYIRMTRPDLADQFNLQLSQIYADARVATPNDEDLKLHTLREMIVEEQIATFYYKERYCKVAPVEITLDSDGTKILRAFQMFPNQRWRKFKIAEMKFLANDEDTT